VTVSTIVTMALTNWDVRVWRQISVRTNNFNANLRKFVSHKDGIVMAQKTVMTKVTSPVHVDLLIVTTTILNVKTKSAFTKVSSVMVKMIAVMLLTNLQVMDVVLL
jgi:hypothetical protein